MLWGEWVISLLLEQPLIFGKTVTGAVQPFYRQATVPGS
jgi:hypothetical protein